MECSLDFGCAMYETVSFEDVDVGKCGGTARCVSAVRGAVSERSARLLEERLGDRRACDNSAQRQVTARHSLGECDHVRLDVPPLHTEPRAEPSEAADHRVCDCEHAVLPADPDH